MSWNPTGLWESVVLSFLVSILSGLALVMLIWVFKLPVKWKQRREAVKEVRTCFRDWQTTIEELAHDEPTQFRRHETKLCQMKGMLTASGSYLPKRQMAKVSELICDHEELIEWRLNWVSSEFGAPLPQHKKHLALVPDDFKAFFSQANSIQWLKLGKAKPRK